jgi:hypothetical protein
MKTVYVLIAILQTGFGGSTGVALERIATYQSQQECETQANSLKEQLKPARNFFFTACIREDAPQTPVPPTSNQ